MNRTDYGPFLGAVTSSGRRSAASQSGVVDGAALPLKRRRGERRFSGGGLREIRELKSGRERGLDRAVGVSGESGDEGGGCGDRRRGREVDCGGGFLLLDLRRNQIPILVELSVGVRQRRQANHRRRTVNLESRSRSLVLLLWL